MVLSTTTVQQRGAPESEALHPIDSVFQFETDNPLVLAIVKGVYHSICNIINMPLEHIEEMIYVDDQDNEICFLPPKSYKYSLYIIKC
jgi:hypothetical protein